MIHTRRGMGAEDYCTCDEPWPCWIQANQEALAASMCPIWAHLLRQRRDPHLVLALIESALSPDGRARIRGASQRTTTSGPVPGA